MLLTNGDGVIKIEKKIVHSKITVKIKFNQQQQQKKPFKENRKNNNCRLNTARKKNTQQHKRKRN